MYVHFWLSHAPHNTAYFSIQMYRWQDQGELPALPFGSLTLITLHRWISHIRQLCHLLCFTSGGRVLLKLPGVRPVLGTKPPSERTHLWVTVQHQYNVSWSSAYAHQSAGFPAGNPIINNSVLHLLPVTFQQMQFETVDGCRYWG